MENLNGQKYKLNLKTKTSMTVYIFVLSELEERDKTCLFYKKKSLKKFVKNEIDIKKKSSIGVERFQEKTESLMDWEFVKKTWLSALVLLNQHVLDERLDSGGHWTWRIGFEVGAWVDVGLG